LLISVFSAFWIAIHSNLSKKKCDFDALAVFQLFSSQTRAIFCFTKTEPQQNRIGFYYVAENYSTSV